MQDGIVELNSVPTHIYTWGGWIDEKIDEKITEMVLLITGNPGSPYWYINFCEKIYNDLGKKSLVWLIGHAGHVDVKDPDLKMPKLKTNKHLYDLNGQINHKVHFIEEYIPEQIKKIYVVGHSIGARIALDLLRFSKKYDEKVEKCFLMFPTITKIADSPNGKFFMKVRHFFFIVLMATHIFKLLPYSIRYKLMKWHCGDVDDDFVHHSVKFTNPRVVEKVLYMAVDEMYKVKELDEEIIEQNLHRIKLYYGRTDQWVKTEYYNEIVEKFPGIDAELCDKNFEHAFVTKSSNECGEMIANWIKEHQEIS